MYIYIKRRFLSFSNCIQIIFRGEEVLKNESKVTQKYKADGDKTHFAIHSHTSVPTYPANNQQTIQSCQ